MEQKNNVLAIALAIIITALVVGGGVYWWQKNQVSQPITKEITAPVVSDSVLYIADLSFTLPKGWLLDKEVAKIKVPDPKYNVILPMRVMVSDYKIDQEANKLLEETSSGAKIYRNICAPAIECYYLVYNGKTYSIDFEMVESNQPAPENLDGLWSPDTTVTRNDTLNFLTTVK